jgi:hypothetical protein
VLRLTDFVGTTLDEVGETQARVVDEIAAEISAVVGLPAAAKPVAHGSVNPGSAG